MQDGTKIRAAASPRSMHRESTIRENWERAGKRVEEMGDPWSEEASPRTRQARLRVRREQQERLDQAMEGLEKLRKLKAARSPHKRVSISDPEARMMKQADGGRALGYNAQVPADGAEGFMVEASLAKAASDWNELLPAV